MALFLPTGSAVSAQLWLAVVAGIPLVGALMTADLDVLMKLAADAVQDALHAAHITHEQAAGYMAVQVGQFRRQLRAEPGNHLSVARLLLMPLGFWLHLGPTLVFLVAKRAYRQIADDVSARRV